MSLISEKHTAQVYDAKKSKPFTGQRLVVTIAKKDAQKNYGPHLQQTMATSIPYIDLQDIEDNSEALLPHLVSWLESQQNALISSRIKEGHKEVTTSELSIKSVIAFMSESSTGEKWDAQRISEWFNDNLAEPIGTRLIENGAPEERMEKVLIATSKRFSETLSSRGVISQVMATELSKALAFAPDKTDGAYLKFKARIDKALEAKSLEDSLGF